MNLPLPALTGLGIGGLKKRSAPRSRFTEIDFSTKIHRWSESATVRLRNIDTFRLHVPESKERTDMKIPEGIERINVQSRTDLLILCGGYAGVRFSSEVKLSCSFFLCINRRIFRNL